MSLLRTAPDHCAAAATSTAILVPERTRPSADALPRRRDVTFWAISGGAFGPTMGACRFGDGRRALPCVPRSPSRWPLDGKDGDREHAKPAVDRKRTAR